MKYASHLFALAVVVAGLFRVAPALAQPLSYDRAVVCGSGDGSYGWGPSKLVVDAQGNTYVAGIFNGTVVLGNSILSATQTPAGSAFPVDNFVAKLDAAGTYLWAVQLGDNQRAGVYGLTVDATGDVYLTGGFDGYSLRVGTSGPLLFNSSANSEGFVAKISGTTGQTLWARRAGGTGRDSFRMAATTPSGDVYVLGSSNSATADVGPFTLNGAQDFLAKLSPAGTWLWARRVGTGTVGVTAMQLDTQGDLYVAGGFTGPSATFGSFTLTTQGVPGSPAAANGYDLFVGRVSDAGTWRWAVQGDAVTHQNLINGAALAFDGAGYLYVTGSYTNTSARIGGTVLPNLSAMYPPPIGPAPPMPYTNNYMSDAFVARLDAGTGVWDWAVRNGGVDNESAYVFAADAQGRVYVGGSIVAATPSGRAQLAELNGATGGWRSFRQLSPLGVYTMALDGQERLYLAGFFNSATAQFGPVTLAQAGAGNSTGFVARTGTRALAAAGTHLPGMGLGIWPNPVAGGPVQIQGPPPGQLVQVLDVLGRTVATGHMPPLGPLSLALPNTATAGLYVVRSGTQAKQLVKE